MAKELLLFDDYPCSTGVVDYVSRHETQVKRSKCNYRKRIDNALQRVCKFDLMQANAAMPTLRPYEIESAPKALVPYNVWRSGSAKGDCVHFFVSDYMFIGLLNASDDELRELAEARFVISPDFSQYADMTPGQRRHNCLLNRLVAARMQSLGVNIIVNATWSTPDSFAYCFDGIPTGCAIAINSMGVNKHDVSKYLWRQGYAEAIRRLNPCRILRYGPKMGGELEGISTYYGNNHLNRMRNGR